MGRADHKRSVCVALGAIAIGLASCSSAIALALPQGNDTATIAVAIPHSGQPSFSGTIAGRELDGSVVKQTNPLSAAFTYKGSLGGHPYVLHVTLEHQSPSLPITFNVTGSYGSEAVTAGASWNLESNFKTYDVALSGHIGSQVLSGEAKATSSRTGVAIMARLSIR